QQCLSTLENENDGHIAWNTSRNGDRRMFHATINSQTSTPLLRVWVKATLANGEWKDALVAAANVNIRYCAGALHRDRCRVYLQLKLPRPMIYRAVCERLEMVDRITDAVECFHEMTSGLGGEVYMIGPMTEWVCGEFM
ncbi:hypothetical protein EV363DRAFT_1171198, partial [Boletus edulis]